MSTRPLIKSLMACVVASASVALMTAAPAAAEEPPPVGFDNFSEMSATHTQYPIIANGRINLNSSVLGEIHCINTFYGYGWNEHEHNETTKPKRGFGEVVGWGTSACEAPQEEKSLEAIYHKKITTAVSAEMPTERELKEAVVCTTETKFKLSECPNASEREPKNVINVVRRRVASLPWLVELTRGERLHEPAILQRVGLHEYGESGTSAGHSTKCYPKEGANPAVFTKVPSGCVAVTILFPQIPLEFVFYGTQEIDALNGFGSGLNASHLEFIEAGKLFSSEGLDGEGETTGTVNLFGAKQVELMISR